MKNLVGLLLSITSLSVSAAKDRPNILWLTSEDNGISWVSSYGSKNAHTPNIDKLAEEGFRYAYCFDNAAVCAPTRSTWITGMYAISMGTQPMRSRYHIPHDKVPYYPDLLRKAGYYTSNHTKTDYNIGSRADKECWDYAEEDEKYGWRLREPGQPFFAIVNDGTSHESSAHGKNVKDALYFTQVKEYGVDPKKMDLYDYHPDLPAVRESYARYASRVEAMDRNIGKTIAALKEDGLYEDTIIIYNSDHGGVLPRAKRFVYSSGIHCPLVVRIPEKWKHLWPANKTGTVIDRLVSFVDMPKTWLSLAGADVPDSFQGTVFLGEGIEPEPDYHLGFRERADARHDNVRVIRDKRYAYHVNYMPYAPAGQYLEYMWRIPLAPAWEAHYRQGKTDEITGRFFEPRVSEEFYDNKNDFDNVHNLIDEPKHKKRIATLKKALRKRQLELYDSGLIPEAMRNKRAREYGMTIYDMVRDPKLYPLADYLDAADRALLRDPKNVRAFIRDMKNPDSAIRYWAVVGLHLLDSAAQPAIVELQKALEDEEEEVVMIAAWTLVKLGNRKEGLARLESMIGHKDNLTNEKLYNIIDWMDEDGKPLVKACLKYFEKKGKPMDRHRIVQKLADEFEMKSEFWN